ncbi:MAG: SEL1-like repeat protein [Xanthomonadales bacterium]|nr:SEL1-like repeat protein [Xanthomonadales bacterium]
MKKFTYIILFFISSTVNADFISAIKNYDEKNYKLAFDEFLVLAQLGNIKAQHNIAVLYYNGEGINKDLELAYAWSVISDSNNDKYKDFTQTIKNKLTKEQIKSAEIIAIEYWDKYSFEKSKLLLAPSSKKTDTNKDKTNSLNERFEPVKQPTPSYPKKMLRKRMHGWVDVQFNIYPGGIAKDYLILEEVPTDSGFAKEVIKTVEKYKFKLIPDEDGMLPFEPIPVTQRIEFTISGEEVALKISRDKFFDDLKNKALGGDISSQYSYAVLYESLLKEKSDISGSQINEWLFNASQDGNIDAQFRLGKKIYNGEDCKVEKQKGIDWIIIAAQMGNRNAQFLTYQLLKNTKKNLEQQLAYYWLQQAANNGHVASQLKYAEVIATMENPSDKQLQLAEDYLDKYKNKIFKTIQWYEVNAMLQNTKGNYSKALKSIDTAIKNAKKAEWDLSELKQQKELILKNKNSA